MRSGQSGGAGQHNSRPVSISTSVPRKYSISFLFGTTSTLLPCSLRNEVWRKLLCCICKHVSSCTCLIFQGPLSPLSLNADLCGLHTSTCPLLTRQKQFNVFAVMRPPHVPILLLFGHCPHDLRFSIMNKTESTSLVNAMVKSRSYG